MKIVWCYYNFHPIVQLLSYIIYVFILFENAYYQQLF